ncbi:MAG: TRAP transporter substrate-binding protein DctP [Chromatiaceae bacterium]|nr:TRAP transporter substrate-binding protein DctP [Chromatiaceae bacterium]MCP5422612.1 TRAP transporter substrate-binding protein DctP [Chromatiaceae bacterium]
MNTFNTARPLIAALFIASVAGAASAETIELKASHQWPGGKGDIRDEMVQMIARHMDEANTGVHITVYPGKSLFKPKEQWGAMTKGKLDITAFPLAYAGGRHPEFNLTLMPGLVKNHDHARRLNKSEFMQRIKKIMDDAGVIVLADTWLAGGFVSTKQCALEPDDVKGMKYRAAGKAFEQMLQGAGASITSMPSSEIYSGLQTGVLDGAITSSSSLVSYRIYEQVKCLTAPGANALWVMYEPILMAKESFDKLSPAQQQEIMKAGQQAEEFAYKASIEADQKLVDAYKNAGVQVVEMSAEQAAMWRKIADTSSYKAFADEVKGGRELLDMALSVE